MSSGRGVGRNRSNEGYRRESRETAIRFHLESRWSPTVRRLKRREAAFLESIPRGTVADASAGTDRAARASVAEGWHIVRAASEAGHHGTVHRPQNRAETS